MAEGDQGMGGGAGPPAGEKAGGGLPVLPLVLVALGALGAGLLGYTALRMRGPAPRIVEVPAPPSEERILEAAERKGLVEGKVGREMVRLLAPEVRRRWEAGKGKG